LLQAATPAPKNLAPFIKGALAFAFAVILETQRLAEQIDAQKERAKRQEKTRKTVE
jgi:hypothetical protein